MMMVVQQVRVVWTKASRGAPGATLRNALPRALPLPLAWARYLSHLCVFTETATGFEQSDEHHRLEDDYRDHEGELLLDLQGEALTVGYGWTEETGLPPRREKRAAMVLQPGELGRLVVNGRHALESGHTYTQDTFNVALAEMARKDLFTSRAPDKVFSLEAELL